MDSSQKKDRMKKLFSLLSLYKAQREYAGVLDFIQENIDDLDSLVIVTIIDRHYDQTKEMIKKMEEVIENCGK